MTIPTKKTTNPRFTAPTPDEVDGLLKQFFEDAMPPAWPDCPRPLGETGPVPPLKLTKSRLHRWPSRLAVAAAVGGLVIGYLGLQSWFPDPRLASTPSLLGTERIARLPVLIPGPFIDRTPSGRPVSGEIQSTPVPKQFMIRVEEILTDK